MDSLVNIADDSDEATLLMSKQNFIHSNEIRNTEEVDNIDRNNEHENKSLEDNEVDEEIRGYVSDDEIGNSNIRNLQIPGNIESGSVHSLLNLRPLTEHSNWEIVLLTLKHMLWVLVTTSPNIIVVCLMGFALSRVPYTYECTIATKKLGCMYYNENILFGVNRIVRLILDSIMITVVVSVFLTDKKLFANNLLYVTTPAVIIGVHTFIIMFELNVKLLFYYIDASVAELFFFIIMISCLVNISRKISEILLRSIFIKLIGPVVFGSTGYIFSTIYLCNRFKVAETTEKFLIRLLYYPLIVEGSLSLQEYSYRTFDGSNAVTVHGRAHFVFLTQVSFGLLGRYMTTIAGSLTEVLLFSTVLFIKDITFHRLSWLQCWLCYKVKKILRMKDSEMDFDEWFYSSKFQEFRACVLNNDFINEIAIAFIVPVMVVSFKSHKLLFNFDYTSFGNDGNGSIDFFFFFKAEAIQFSFIFITFFVIAFIEAKYNKLDLRIVYKSNSKMEIISRFVIFSWGIFCLLSSVTLVPSVGNCKTDDICTCRYNINKTLYGCSKNNMTYQN